MEPTMTAEEMEQKIQNLEELIAFFNLPYRVVMSEDDEGWMSVDLKQLRRKVQSVSTA